MHNSNLVQIDEAAFEIIVFWLPAFASVIFNFIGTYMSSICFLLKKYVAVIEIFSLLFLISNPINAQAIAIKRDPSVGEQENLNVFHQWAKWSAPGSISSDLFLKIANEAYSQRQKQIDAITTLGEWKLRQKYVKQTLKKIFAPSFVSGPLNARTTGVIHQKGYRIEKIIFESVPGYYVTGCIYIPEKIKGRAPAVLNLMGHDQEAFRAELYQLINANLALKGIIVLTIDPPGQGEMVQYYDSATGSSSIGYSVIEHCYFSNQCFLSGISPAVHFVRDGMRAIDYLLSRKDVDQKRIGVTGFSGGGTITSYLAAVDERIKVSIPSSWSTASRRQIETKGTQDGETVLLNALSQGITFEDLLEVRAPKPTMMTFDSRDQYLSVQGAREAFAEAKKIYKAYDSLQQLQLVEDDSKHWLTLKIRKAIYSFFMLNFDMKADDSEFRSDILSVKELSVTPTGQVSTAYHSKQVFDLNKQQTEKLIAALAYSRKNNSTHIEQIKTGAKKLSAYSRDINQPYSLFFNGRYQRQNYSVSKIALQREEMHPIPILLFIPDDTATLHPAVIYVHPLGKDAQGQAGEEIEKLVSKGCIVASVDIFNTGEIKNNVLRDISIGYSSILTGKSVTGIQAEEINTVASFLKSLRETDKKKIVGVATGQLCFPMIHAAALENVLTGIALRDCPASYESLVMNRIYRVSDKPHDAESGSDPMEDDFSWGVAGALTEYDIPDLLAAIAPRSILISGARDHLFQPASEQVVKKQMEYPASVYDSLQSADHLRITGATEILSQMAWMIGLE